jgi:1-acyl-sn-glycerol-3-phosphate acyltransferase
MATMEVVLMIVYAPWQLEMLGAGDIAPPPWMRVLTKFYGFIPVNRGNFDRPALRQAMAVLEQDGILGIFPEGGVWDPGAMEAKRGVAWLSYHTHSPILPIGFGGVEGALDATFKLRRPPLTMNVGQLLPPVEVPPGVPRRQALQHAANEILNAVEGLIPTSYRREFPKLEDERFELELTAYAASGREVPIPDTVQIAHADALCKFFYRPWLMHIFTVDLHLPAEPLEHLDAQPAPQTLVAALDPILHYVTQDNPGFFTYRFGHVWGVGMQTALGELRDLCAWASEAGLGLLVHPTRRYRIQGQEEEIVETWPGDAHVW